MEFLFVEFPEKATVLGDGRKVGATNHLLMLERGKHNISLEGNKHSPESRTVTLSGTSEANPKIVSFTLKT